MAAAYEHREVIGSRPGFAGADLSGADLAQAKLRNADLISANLTGTNLVEVDLIEANLFNATLSAANLTGAVLRSADLREANLVGADLHKADLRWAHLPLANLSHSNLREAAIQSTNLNRADVTEADLTRSDLTQANNYQANLAGANLAEAILAGTSLIRTNLERADLTACRVFGISVWSGKLDGAQQCDLLITRDDEPAVRVDNLEVAQFVYLLLNNEKIREVIDTITSKVVLILGRFTQERKIILETIRDELHRRGYLPVLFDFEKPASKDLTGTVSTLANMARFVIADLTDPSSVPHELAMVAPGTVVPIQTILLEGQREYAMFVDLRTRYHWVLARYQYKSKDLLIAHLNENVIAPAEAKAKELSEK